MTNMNLISLAGGYTILENKNDELVQLVQQLTARNAELEKAARATHSIWVIDEFGHKCDSCGEYVDEDNCKTLYCPNCGVKMYAKGERDE